MFEIHKVKSGNYQLYVETLGKNSDPACLLIPGAMQGAWGWSDTFCETIANAGYYVIRFDHRDIGRSTFIQSADDYELESFADDILAILDSLKIEKAHLAGHSMGGHLCQLMAINHPDRVLSICPIASGPLGGTDETKQPVTEEEESILQKTWKVFLARKDSENFEEHVQGFLEVYQYLSGTLPIDENIVRTYIVKMLETSPKHALMPGNPHEKVMQRLGESMDKREGILKEIQLSTLVIHGELDPIALPRFACSMAEEIPGAVLRVIPGMGHMFLSKELEKTLTTLLINHMNKTGRSA